MLVKEDHEFRRSKLFMYEEPKSSVRYRRVACGQRSDPFYMLHGTVSYGKRMKYEILVHCDFEIFEVFR